MNVLLQEGECFSIPLRDGSFAFGQYVLAHPEVGPLIRVFGLRADAPTVPVEGLRDAALAFPPIFVGINPPVRAGRWSKIGRFLIENFEFPKFRRSVSMRKGINTDWRIWDGLCNEFIGTLPPSLRSLEILGVHAYGDVEERILTGKDWLAEGRD